MLEGGGVGEGNERERMGGGEVGRGGKRVDEKEKKRKRKEAEVLKKLSEFKKMFLAGMVERRLISKSVKMR